MTDVRRFTLAHLRGHRGALARLGAWSVAESLPSTVAVRVAPFWKLTVTLPDPATTWSAVRMCPWVSTTMPVPVSVACAFSGIPNGPVAFVVVWWVMSTTPGFALA